MHLNVTMLLMGMGSLAKADSLDRYGNQISCDALAFNISYPQGHLYIQLLMQHFCFSLNRWEENKKFTRVWKSFLDRDLGATAGQFGGREHDERTLVRKELQPFLSCFSKPIIPYFKAQNGCFWLLSISPLSCFVSSFHAFAHAVSGVPPPSIQKIPIHTFRPSSRISVRSFLGRMGRRELTHPLCLTDNEFLHNF